MVEQVRQKLIEFMKTTNKTQTKISKETGLSTAVISQFLKGTYAGNNEETANTINKYLTLNMNKVETTGINEFYPELGNTKQVLFSVKYAHQFGEIVMIHGDAGTGKTTALKFYADNNTNETLITANATSRTPKAILSMITESIGKQASPTEFKLMTNLTNNLKDTNKLLIIDEADHLTPRALQAIRNLNDISGIGIVLAGNEIIYHQMYGRGSMQFDQLRTRAMRTNMKNNYTVDEIQHIFTDADTDCIAYMVKVACTNSLRTAKKLYKATQLYSQSKKITASILKSVFQRLFNEMV